MNSRPVVRAVVTLLNKDEGGRNHPVFDGYRPHIVVGDPRQQDVTRIGTRGTEQYLGVQFDGMGRTFDPGTTQDVTLILMYEGVDYRALKPGATFTILEGTTVVGFGIVSALGSLAGNEGDRRS